MAYIIGILLLVLFAYFILVPIFAKLLQLLGNLIAAVFAFAVGIALIIGTIYLCVLFPPLIIPVVILVIYAYKREGESPEEN